MFPITDEILDMFPRTGDIHSGVPGHVEMLDKLGYDIQHCAFWKKDNSGYYVEEFADILESMF